MEFAKIRVLHICHSETDEQLLSEMRKTTRYEIRRAERLGIKMGLVDCDSGDSEGIVFVGTGVDPSGTMLLMKRQTLLVPEKVRVMILRGESGAYIAELPDLDVHTEAGSPAELMFMINDLLYAYFEVPKHLRMFVRYAPERHEDSLDISSKRSVLFQKFISSEAQRVLYS